ncbi:MAG: lycopene cyclase family protein [Pseudomonadota bacterium]|nr:lycopene cyclase family protein [Pseudomonadota bacterium]
MNAAVPRQFDVAILGGGMSGLALACHLDERNAQGDKCVRNGVVLEPRTDYQRDKTWCYWQQQPGLFDQAITHSWSSWEVRSAGRRWVSTCAQTPYVRVDSGRYYELAAAKLAQSNTLALNLNVGAQTIARLDDCFKVETTQGDLLARRVVDTRPRAIPEGTLLQHFYGWEIETEKDVFDPSTVTLMDFGAGSADNIHFYYVLPFSPRSALVETTHFSKETGSIDQYETELRHYLQHRYGLARWQIKHTEQGVLPMAKRGQKRAQRADCDALSLGLHGGTVKPSTGYCFPHAQDQAAELALWLTTARGTSPPRLRGFAARWFDGVFVTFLENQAPAAPDAFLRLFQRVSPDALVRFLSDRATPLDYLRVIAALPKLPMLKEALRYVFQR